MAEETEEDARPLAEISHGPSAFEAFLDRNQKGMIALAVLIVLAAGAWIVVRGIKEDSEMNAGEMLASAESVDELQEVVKDLPSTQAAGSSQVLISEMQWDNGEQEAAIETLRGFIATNTDHPALPSAKASLGSRLMQQGNNDEAAALFRELVDSPDARFIAPFALVSLGDIAKSAGEIEEAEEFYKRAQNDYGTNQFGSLAQQRLKLVNFTAPTEIDPPAAPEPDAEDALNIDLTPGMNPTETGGHNPLEGILEGTAEVVEPTEPADSTPAESSELPIEEPSEMPSEGDSN